MSWNLRLSVKRKLSAAIVAVGCAAGGAQAGPFSDLFVFGDSLTDTGNVLALTTAFAPPPFPSFPGAEGRFSDGPVWIEHLAAGLGLPNGAVPSRLLTVPDAGMPGNLIPIPIGIPGGTNYAYGGARTGLGGSAGPTTGLLGQLISWNGVSFDPGPPADSLTRLADPNALYVVLAGANDLRDIRGANFGSTAADIAARAAAADVVASNVVDVVGALAQQGARNFLLSNLPDLGATPEAAFLDLGSPGLQDASTDVTQAFNASLAARSQALDSFFDVFFMIDLDIRMLDLWSFGETVRADAASGGPVFGITNVDAPCMNPVLPGLYYFPGSVAVDCGSALFSDPLHPSSRAHELIADRALRLVPEPGSLALVLLAGAALAATRRRRAA